MANEEKLWFDQGWDAAIAEVKEKVEEYIEAKQEGQPLGPWEEWLPRLLELAGRENMCHHSSDTGSDAENAMRDSMSRNPKGAVRSTDRIPR